MAVEILAPIGWFALQLATSALAGILAAGSRIRFACATLVVAFGLMLPALTEPQESALRLLMALFGILSGMRLADLAVDKRSWSWLQRVWLMLAIVDSREVRATKRAFDWIAFLLCALGLSLIVTAFAGAELVDRRATGLALLWRWSCGAAMCYLVLDSAQQGLRWFYRLLGVSIPELHRHPILATTVREFWGERWNLVVHEWLRRHFFWPFARRRQPTLGIILAFLASAFIHFWAFFVALDLVLAIPMGLFFLIQGVWVWIETILKRPARDERWMARVITISAVAIPSPLFVEPALRVFEGWESAMLAWVQAAMTAM
jgi:D-alanyl-lipoteichoic acid acyltransferase DltB (MBOAT superfamily)